MDCANPYQAPEESGTSPFSITCAILEMLWMTELMSVSGSNVFCFYYIVSNKPNQLLPLTLVNSLAALIFLRVLIMKKQLFIDQWISAEAFLLLFSLLLIGITRLLIHLST
jgi:hypothetical protein